MDVSNGRPTKLDLTFGVEIECVLLQDPEEDTRVIDGRLLVFEALKGATQPLYGNCATCKTLHYFNLPLNHPYPNHVPQRWQIPSQDNYTPQVSNNANARRFQNWSIATEEFLECDDLSGQFDEHFKRELVKSHPVEIKSRIMSQGRNLMTAWNEDGSHRHEITYQEEIRVVMQALFDTFNSLDKRFPGWGLIVNNNCGFHVHVGNGQNGFPLQSIKNILTLHNAIEQSIDSLHAAHRIDGASFAFQPALDAGKPSADRFLFKGAYNMPWSSHFEFWKDDRKPRLQHRPRKNQYYPFKSDGQNPHLEAKMQENNIPARVAVVYYAPKLDDLLDLQAPDWHRSTLNLENLVDPHPGRPNEPLPQNQPCKHTIEFRQHAGTLDSLEMLAWIDVLLRIVTHAHQSPMTTTQLKCEANWRNPMFETLQFLRMLGLRSTDITFQHYRWVTGMQKAVPIQSYREHCLGGRQTEAIQQTNVAQMVALEYAPRYANSRDFHKVRERIQEKFLAGCYGQYESNWLDHLIDDPQHALTAAERMRLQIGWTPLPPSVEDRTSR